MPKKLENYSNAKIYKIVNRVDATYYLGSTCSSLAKRLSAHKTDSRLEHKKRKRLFQHIESIGGWDSVEIVLVEECKDIENCEQLMRKENEYIEKSMGDLNCLNMIRAKRDLPEADYARQYRQDNPDKVKETNKKYHDSHKKERAEHCKEWRRTSPKYEEYKQKLREENQDAVCSICGCTVRRLSMTRHQQTKKCQSKATSPQSP